MEDAAQYTNLYVDVLDDIEHIIRMPDYDVMRYYLDSIIFTISETIKTHRAIKSLPLDEQDQAADLLLEQTQRFRATVQSTHTYTHLLEQGKRDLAEKLKTIIKKAVEEICTVTEIAEILTMYEQASYTTTAPSLFLPYSTDDTTTVPSLPIPQSSAEGEPILEQPVPEKRTRKRRARAMNGEEDDETRSRARKSKRRKFGTQLDFSHPTKPTTETSVINVVRITIGPWTVDSVPDGTRSAVDEDGHNRTDQYTVIARFQHSKKRMIWELKHVDDNGISMRIVLQYADISMISFNQVEGLDHLVQIYIVLHDVHQSPWFFTLLNSAPCVNYNKPWVKSPKNKDITPNEVATHHCEHILYVDRSEFTERIDSPLSVYETLILSDPYICDISRVDNSMPAVGQNVVVKGLQTMDSLKAKFVAALDKIEAIATERGLSELKHCLLVNASHKFKFRASTDAAEPTIAINLDDWMDIWREVNFDVGLTKEEFHYIVSILRIGENGICLFKHVPFKKKKKNAPPEEPVQEDANGANNAAVAAAAAVPSEVPALVLPGTNPEPVQPAAPGPRKAKKGKQANPVRVAVHLSVEAMYRVLADELKSNFWRAPFADIN